MNDDRLDDIIKNAAREYHVPNMPPRDEMWARIEQARRQAGVAALRRSQRAAWLWPVVGIAAVLVIGFGIGRLFERSQNPTVAQRHDTVPSPNAAVAAVSPNSPDSTPSGTDSTATPTPTAPQRDRKAISAHRLGDVASGDRSSRSAPNDVGPSHDDATSNEGLAFRLAVLQHLAGTEAMLTTFRTEAKSGDVDARLTIWARNLLRTTHLLQASSVASNDPTLKRLLDDLELVLLQIAQYTAKSPHRAEELELIERSIDKRGVMAKLRATNPAAPMPAGT
jgi:hypothetical protein